MYRCHFVTTTSDVTSVVTLGTSAAAALVTQLRGRRFLAGVKYWFVCSTVLVAVLALQYYVPISYKYAPNFGYSAAAVGMSDRVESTIYKVRAHAPACQHCYFRGEAWPAKQG